MGLSLGSALGAGLGGILGGSDASSGPAGYTTKTDTKNSTTTEDVPEWLRSFYESTLSGGSALRDSLTGSVNPLYGMSDAEMAKTIGGDYLNPSSNPYLEKTGDIIAGKVGRAVDSRFESAGRYGSGAHQQLLSENIGDVLNSLYGANYNAERGRQLTTATNLPTYTSGVTNSQFLPYLDFTKLIPNLKSSTTNSTGTSTEPYFRNKGAGILGGALAGSQLGGMFGGGDISSLFSGGGADMFGPEAGAELTALFASNPELAAAAL